MHKGVTDFEEMTNLSKELRQTLREKAYITRPQVERKQVSKEDGTIKYLWELADGNCVESVLMRYRTATPCASPPRWAAGWAVPSAPPPSRGRFGT